MNEGLARAAFDAVTKYFEDPAVKAEYEEWLRARKDKKNEERK